MTEENLPVALTDRDLIAHDADLEASRTVERRLVGKEVVAALVVVAIVVIRLMWAG